MTTFKDKPAPGSPEAVQQGCSCPISDNARGMGAWGTSGPDAVYWINATCPLHGVLPPDEPERKAA